MRDPLRAAVGGRIAGSEQGGLKPRAGKMHHDEDFGKSMLSTTAKESQFGIKGKGESVGTGRAVRSEGPTLPRGRGTPNRMCNPGCIQHPSAPGDAASSQGQAAFLSYSTAGEKGEKGSRYPHKGRNHHLNFIVLSLESLSIPQNPDLRTCNDAACPPHWSTANLHSLVFVAWFRTLNQDVLKKRNTLGTKHADNTDAHTKYASIKA